MARARRDPYLDFNFLVEIDGVTVSGFTEADVPEGRIHLAPYREGSDRTNTARLLPAGVEYGPLVLRRGFGGDPALFQWWRSVADGNADRRNVLLIVRDAGGEEVCRWTFPQALPLKYVGPSFHARATEVAIETLELAVETLEFEQS
jgi:phage tail-like protein